MENTLVQIQDKQVVTSSRKVAEVFGKNHQHVLRTVRDILGGMSKIGHTKRMFFLTSQTNEQNGQEYPEYLMNRDGFTLLVMGFTGKAAMEWKLRYIAAFNEMEAELNRRADALPDFTNPVEAARAWADAMEAHQKAMEQIEVNKPKVLFADAVSISETDCTIGTLAKILKQNGIKTGQNRLFAWLRTNGYLHKGGKDKNRPLQKYMEQGLFRVREGQSGSGDSVLTFFTTYVTGKGQQYFVNLFLNKGIKTI